MIGRKKSSRNVGGLPEDLKFELVEPVRESDSILREEFAKAKLDKKIGQYFTVAPDFKAGVKNARVFEHMVILRAINTTDAMTAWRK